MGLVFAMGKDFFEKTGFRQKLKFRKKITIFCAKKLIFLSFGDIFTFPNACAIQTNLGTKGLLVKTVLEIMGYWQNGLAIEKMVCDFKVPVGRLGLTTKYFVYYGVTILVVWHGPPPSSVLRAPLSRPSSKQIFLLLGHRKCIMLVFCPYGILTLFNSVTWYFVL